MSTESAPAGRSGKRLNKRLAAISAVVALAVGSLAVATISPIGLASAQTPEAFDSDQFDSDQLIAALVQRWTDRIQAKVDDGSIDQDRADEIIASLEDKATALVNGERPEHNRNWGREWQGKHPEHNRNWNREWRQGHRGDAKANRGARLAPLAEALGMETGALAQALRGGQTIAGDHTDGIVAALVQRWTHRIQAKVDDGSIDQDRADEITAGLEDKATALVNGERLGWRQVRGR